MKRRRPSRELKLPEKANRILNGILVVLILIVFKIWHLAVVQHDEKVVESKKPQERVVVERSERATIMDRFGVPLAINKVQYNAAITYAPIRNLPRSIWKRNENGKREKVLYRKEYITELACLLAKELNVDAERIEDLIHSKAAVLGNVPCMIKENISESQFFKLKMLEKDWPGIYADIAAKRCYPQGATAGEVIGYLGPISRSEYETITQELSELRNALLNWEEGENSALKGKYVAIEDIKMRLEELEKKAYTINDFVGKAGIESAFDESLRGLRGKHIYLSDIRGNYLCELPGSEPPTEGNRIVLSLSAELQEFAEILLGEYDSAPMSQRPQALKLRSLIPENEPWIKGGAIVAMHPKTGEVYALASFPRFDPNDFILTGETEEIEEKKNRVHRWLEDERNISNIWDLKIPFTKEHFNPVNAVFDEEKKEMSWDTYLRFILPSNSPVRRVLEEKKTVADAIWVQRKMDQLISLFQTSDYEITPIKVIDYVYRDEENVPLGALITLQERSFLDNRYDQIHFQAEEIKKELYPFLKSLPLNYEKILLVDLYRIVVDARCFSPLLTDLVGSVSIEDYREISGRMVAVTEALQKIVYDLFCEIDFKKWREENFKEFLAKKREEEKESKRKFVRPFIEYLDHMKQDLFSVFWEKNQWDFLSIFLTGQANVKTEHLNPYMEVLENWATELKAGAHRALPWVSQYTRVKEIVNEFEFPLIISYLQTMRSFNELNRPLLGTYRGLKGNLEKHMAAAFYPIYGFGYARSHAFRQATTIGSIFKLVPAYEALKQRYLMMKENDSQMDLNPLTIVDDKHRTWGKDGGWNVGFTLDGHVIPMFYKGGRLPRSEHPKVGRVDLIRALETSSNPYFALLAGDVLEDPEDLCAAANLFGFGEKTQIDLPGEYPGKLPIDLAYNRTGLYAMAIGQHSLVGTPLQTAVMLSAIANGGEILKPKIVGKRISKGNEEYQNTEVRWRVFLPTQIQHLLLSGLRQVVMGDKGTARTLRRHFSNDMIQTMIGKTSTAEVIEKMSLDGTSGSLKLKHVWFGAISYESFDFSKPELVVVVYLRFGEFGRDVAPIAAKIIQKWRQIKSKHRTS